MLKRLSVFSLTISLMLLLLIGSVFAATDCKECEEVDKGRIPEQFLDHSLKMLPSGIVIWDLEEAIPALKDKDAKYLWVDTRPGSFLEIGTIKNAVNLVCDLQGVAIPDADAPNAITKEKLVTAMETIDPNVNAVTVIFFCQGPKCHRSYNAALRSIKEYGLSIDKVVWFREGYPNLEKHILSDPKLKRRITKYLRGKVTQ
ncbi:rhodanese-like domain-containing protein [uncultured Desulfobacter sp.]|uniref:rhodanese-like domain-containing protein n=1 Tax=uncultured Desulfobacter sp. TaxID=240139 RepID=UPI002AAB1EE5|nr:rhodanese-like domain-containing protein [uncultured Desulfobacter sp.]